MNSVGSRRDTLLFVRRFLADYRRNPVNLLVLVLVPVVFVVVAARPMSDAARLLGGTGPSVGTATAGWAAGFLAGVAMYFQTRTARAADRRLVLAGLPSVRLVAARVATGLVLALLASAAALVALAARARIDEPGRVIAGTLMFAAIYLAIGALVGVLVRSPVNATVVILFIWIMDVFFGPALSSADQRLTLAGFRTGALLWARLGVVGLAVLLVTVASLAVTATVFDARQWGVYAGGNLLLAATYSLLGGCLGPIFGRVSGVFLAFLLPFLDVGIGQSPMLRARPPAWAQILPGYGADRVLLDGGLTAHFDETGALLLGLGWLLALGVLAALLFRRARTGHARTR